MTEQLRRGLLDHTFAKAQSARRQSYTLRDDDEFSRHYLQTPKAVSNYLSRNRLGVARLLRLAVYCLVNRRGSHVINIPFRTVKRIS